MKARLIISVFLLSAVITFAGADLAKLTARSQNGNVLISWQSVTESNVRYYVVERKTVNGGFVELVTVYPKNDKVYEYLDQSAYKTTGTLYIYRLKIVDNDGSVSYSWEVSVPHNVSSVKRTWGSIKALFR